MIKNNKIIIEGDRDAITNLWLIPLDNNNKPDKQLKPQSTYIQVQHTANSAYRKKSASRLQVFHHASLGTPVVTTLIRAINNNWLTSFPGLTATGIWKYLPKSTQTTLRHMHKVRQNIQSTQAVTIAEILDENKDKKDPSEEYLPPRKIQNRDHIV